MSDEIITGHEVVPDGDYSKELKIIAQVGANVKHLGMSPRKACADVGISKQTLLRWCNQFEACRKLAQEYELLGYSSIGTSTRDSIAAITEDTTIADALQENQRCSNAATVDFNKMYKFLRDGVPLKLAVSAVGISWKKFVDIIGQNEDVRRKCGEAQAEWASIYMRLVMKAAVKASDRGALNQLLAGAERRFPEEWGKVNSIDLKVRTEHADPEQQIKEATSQFTDMELMKMYQEMKKKDSLIEATFEEKTI